MKLEKANHQVIENRIITFKEKNLQELQSIKPKWAYGKDVEYLIDISLLPQNKEYTIFRTNVSELVTNSQWHEINLNMLFTGEVLNDYRIASILYRWENDAFVDPPTIGLCNLQKGKLSFADGRHRTKLAHFLRHAEIPVAIHNSEIEEVKKILQLIST